MRNEALESLLRRSWQGRSRRWRRTLAAASIFLALLAVTAVGVWTVRQMEADGRTLAAVDLPLFQRLQEFRARLATLQRVYHEYYLSGDGDQFERDLAEQSAAVQSVLQALRKDLPDDHDLAQLSSAAEELKGIATHLHTAMLPPTDWDAARDALAEFTPLADRINQHSQALTETVSTRVSSRAEAGLLRTERGLLWVSLLSAGLLVAAVAVLWLNARRIAGMRERQHLTSFPERNPHPVMALDADGRPRYANPSALHLARLLFDKAHAEALLPDNLDAALGRCRERSSFEQWQYPCADRQLSIGLQWLPDLHEFRVYLDDVTERWRAEERLRHLAYHDELTGLPNRLAFVRRFEPWLKEHPEGSVFAMVDLDHFSRIVARAGHTIADRAMQLCAERLQGCMKQARGEVFRFDGKHFGVLIAQPMVAARAALDGVRQVMAQPLLIDSFEFFVSLSIGVVGCPAQANALEATLRRADVAMRAVNGQGGDGVLAHDDQQERLLRERLELDLALRHAIERDELHLALQPQVDLRSGQVIGAEALLRWQLDGKPVSPAQFIPLAEDSGLIVEIGGWVLDAACRIAADWQQRWAQPPVIAVNVSARQLLQGELPQRVRAALQRHRLPARALELEVTESAALSDLEAAISTLEALRDLGVRLALDDFGTGYSSLNHLARLPLDKLKIDQSFVRDMLINPRDAAIARVVVALARPLALTVIAEGVEAAEQAERLADWGCDEIQGYWIGRPMPLEEFEGWLLARQAGASAASAARPDSQSGA